MRKEKRKSVISTRAPGRRRTAVIVAGGILVLLLLAVFIPIPLDRLVPEPSTVITDRHGELLRITLASDGMWRLPTTEEGLSRDLKAAVLAYEDRHFYRHPGVNPFSLLRAAVANARAGEIVQGGSTITMQVARLIEPKPRTYLGKLAEIFRALQLEILFTKDDILAYYLNLAPYGGNLVGVGAASQFYFGKHPGRIGPGEAALLAAIPRSPNELRPDLRPAAATEARNRVIELIARRGALDEQQKREALLESVPVSRRSAPFEAPHLTTLLASRTSESNIVSTLDLKMQRTAQDLLARHLGPLKALGISNGAVVVIDNESRDVLALVGSGDFFDTGSEGEVNGALAPRSPGSALKPFVYALALDEGRISSRSLVRDLPVDFAGYRPMNFDGLYHGAVTAEDALIRSLNVPAVNLSAQLGGSALYDFLREAGISTLEKESIHYGLALVLGGAGINLLELTSLYAGLADGGRFRRARLTEDDPVARGSQKVAPETAFIITDILSGLRRPDMPASWEWSVNTPKIAWKTGTSYGHRDAWSIGYTHEITIGVWVGNFNGRGAPALVGAEVAAPVLFGLFEAFAGSLSNRWFTPPEGLARRQVCAASGELPTPYCPSTVEEWYLPGVAPSGSCTMHVPVLVDATGQSSYCASCREGHEVVERVYEQWPADLGSWMIAQGFPVPVIPAHNPVCSRIASGESPRIVSPADGSRFRLEPGGRLAYQKVLLQASASNRTSKFYWFLDGDLVHTGSPEERFFLTPEPGHHRLVCQDDEGRTSEVGFTVVG